VTDELPPWHHDKPWSPLELDDIRHNWTETPERFSYAAGRWLATLDAARSHPDEAGLRAAAERLANRAAGAVTEPRLFHEEADRQHMVSEAVAEVRRALSTQPTVSVAAPEDEVAALRSALDECRQHHADTLAGLDPHTGPVAAPEDGLVWLIERGQPEGLGSPEWWGVTDSRTGAYGWVDSAFSADQFAARAEAAAVIARFDLPNHPFTARAVQHWFAPALRAAHPEDDGLPRG
jgi:hypothetical protein